MSLATLIPRPKKVTETKEQAFLVAPDENVAVVGFEDTDPRAQEALVRKALSALNSEGEFSDVARVQLALDADAAAENPEAYKLNVGKDSVTVTATAPKGLHRGLETLRQLVAQDEAGTSAVPAVIIEDEPRFGWRGLSMDVTRNFFPVSEIKALIDTLSLYHMNTLHLHLSDDQGWRLEVPSLPELTEVSGKTAGEGNRSGFYSTKDFQEIVGYAADQGIDVIVEFDTPGHTNAATHALPQLMPSGEPTPAYAGAKVGFSKLYPDVPFTKEFLTTIFESAAQQSSSPYVHVGGDEAYEQPKEEYVELIAQATKAVTDSGKTPVVWQEAATADLPEGTVVQWWRTVEDPAHVVAAAQTGKKVLMSPAPHTYFDMKYDADTGPGQDWAGFIPLQASYDWDPATQVEGVDEGSLVGVEAAMWTEFVPSFEDLMYLLLPRIPATAEVGWSEQETRDFQDFSERIAAHPRYWDAAGQAWHASPEVNWED